MSVRSQGKGKKWLSKESVRAPLFSISRRGEEGRKKKEGKRAVPPQFRIKKGRGGGGERGGRTGLIFRSYLFGRGNEGEEIGVAANPSLILAVVEEGAGVRGEGGIRER